MDFPGLGRDSRMSGGVVLTVSGMQVWLVGKEVELAGFLRQFQNFGFSYHYLLPPF